MEHEKMYNGNLFHKDVEYPINYFSRVELCKDDISECLNYDPFKDIYAYTTNIRAKLIDKTDEAIYSAIIEEAKKAGVSDLFLIDKEFVLSALTNEMERRRGIGKTCSIVPVCVEKELLDVADSHYQEYVMENLSVSLGRYMLEHDLVNIKVEQSNLLHKRIRMEAKVVKPDKVNVVFKKEEEE